MDENRSQYFKIFALISMICIFYSCNIFSPDYEHFDNFSNIGNNNTINGLMGNFVYSYTFKDSFLYEELLNENFVFEYDNNGNTESWTKSEDIRITKRMFRNFKKIDLVFNSIFPQRSSVPDTTIFTSFRIGFYSGEEIINLTGYAEFLIHKDVSENDSTIYTIKNWKDLK